MDNLDLRVQRWVYQQGWTSLRDIQKKAIAPILAAKSDVVISASTAAGKTEAAFLPACSAVVDQTQGFGILYISPLKALINDQYRRLELLCNMLDMPVTSWHGDSSQSKKRKVKLNPQGIILITPESLESLLIRDAGWVQMAFGSLQYIIIDEYHAFVGFERGCHLQSLMHRLENLLERQKQPIPRIALSATLGDMDSILTYLRPNNSFPYTLINGTNNKATLQLQMHGYIDQELSENPDMDKDLSVNQKIAHDLYGCLRGGSHLVFANSRKNTEVFSALLSDLCKKNLVPNEFFPHHGSLSKELRSDLESRLQQEHLPTTAICTMTLELGIDIGKVKSVSQVTPPHSVASLRQRLGRSGRRGEAAILRMYIAERALKQSSSMVDNLRLALLQSIAIIRLLIQGQWYEPADTKLFHFSTLLHQVLAIIAQWGGVRADQLWSLLCQSGTFHNVTVEHFKILLCEMGNCELISQLSSGELVLAEQGERLANHYTFCAVFQTPIEYRIMVNKKKMLGSLPFDALIIPQQLIIFGGRYWKVEAVDSDKKIIFVVPSKGGRPPKFGGGTMPVHDQVRQEMFNIYLNGDYRMDVNNQKVDFLDVAAKSLFQEGLKNFQCLRLKNKYIINDTNNTCVIPWMGDKVVNTLTVLLVKLGYVATSFSGIITVENAQYLDVYKALKQISKCEKKPTNTELAALIEDKKTEKYDYLLPKSLLEEGYGAKKFDMKTTIAWLYKL